MAAKVKALQQWCKVQCDGYRDVAINNMTSSWKSGLAFCAIIHRYRPDLIDYNSLSKENVFENNKLAFDVAESLGIPVLLDPEDMVAMSVPDRLCIITYVSQYYNYFHKFIPASSVAVKRPASDNVTNEDSKRKPVEPSKRMDVNKDVKTGTMQDKCCLCSQKVYLMERHLDSNQLYHRQCFRDHQKAQRTSWQGSDGSSSVAAGNIEPMVIDRELVLNDVTERTSNIDVHASSSKSHHVAVAVTTGAPCSPAPVSSSSSSSLMKSIYRVPSYKASTTPSDASQVNCSGMTGDDEVMNDVSAPASLVSPESGQCPIPDKRVQGVETPVSRQSSPVSPHVSPVVVLNQPAINDCHRTVKPMTTEHAQSNKRAADSESSSLVASSKTPATPTVKSSQVTNDEVAVVTSALSCATVVTAQVRVSGVATCPISSASCGLVITSSTLPVTAASITAASALKTVNCVSEPVIPVVSHGVTRASSVSVPLHVASSGDSHVCSTPVALCDKNINKPETSNACTISEKQSGAVTNVHSSSLAACSSSVSGVSHTSPKLPPPVSTRICHKTQIKPTPRLAETKRTSVTSSTVYTKPVCSVSVANGPAKELKAEKLEDMESPSSGSGVAAGHGSGDPNLVVLESRKVDMKGHQITETHGQTLTPKPVNPLPAPRQSVSAKPTQHGNDSLMPNPLPVSNSFVSHPVAVNGGDDIMSSVVVSSSVLAQGNDIAFQPPHLTVTTKPHNIPLNCTQSQLSPDIRNHDTESRSSLSSASVVKSDSTKIRQCTSSAAAQLPCASKQLPVAKPRRLDHVVSAHESEKKGDSGLTHNSTTSAKHMTSPSPVPPNLLLTSSYHHSSDVKMNDDTGQPCTSKNTTLPQPVVPLRPQPPINRPLTSFSDQSCDVRIDNKMQVDDSESSGSHKISNILRSPPPIPVTGPSRSSTGQKNDVKVHVHETEPLYASKTTPLPQPLTWLNSSPQVSASNSNTLPQPVVPVRPQPPVSVNRPLTSLSDQSCDVRVDNKMQVDDSESSGSPPSVPVTCPLKSSKNDIKVQVHETEPPCASETTHLPQPLTQLNSPPPASASKTTILPQPLVPLRSPPPVPLNRPLTLISDQSSDIRIDNKMQLDDSEPSGSHKISKCLRSPPPVPVTCPSTSSTCQTSGVQVQVHETVPPCASKTTHSSQPLTQLNSPPPASASKTTTLPQPVVPMRSAPPVPVNRPLTSFCEQPCNVRSDKSKSPCASKAATLPRPLTSVRSVSPPQVQAVQSSTPSTGQSCDVRMHMDDSEPSFSSKTATLPHPVAVLRSPPPIPKVRPVVGTTASQEHDEKAGVRTQADITGTKRTAETSLAETESVSRSDVDNNLLIKQTSSSVVSEASTSLRSPALNGTRSDVNHIIDVKLDSSKHTAVSVPTTTIQPSSPTVPPRTKKGRQKRVAPQPPKLEPSVTETSPAMGRKKIIPDEKFTFEKDAFRVPVCASGSDARIVRRPVPSRPAPPCPAVATVVKRRVTAEEQLPVDLIRKRLSFLEEKLKILEQDGRILEDCIRGHSDSNAADDETMMTEWFEMINNKNELVREESDLIYRLKQQELEDQHSQVEYELRRLLVIPEHAKTAADKSQEAELLNQLLLTVHKRNNIVDSMEEDRIRYLQEDVEISQMMSTKGLGKKKKH